MSTNSKLLLIVIMSFVITPANAQNFVVNSVNDQPDVLVGDGICDSSFTRLGGTVCTLRAAIQESNQAMTASNIEFNIPFGCVDDVCTLTIDRVTFGNLPDIVKPVTIDGSIQPGSSAVCTSAIESRPKYGIVVQGDGVDIGLRLEDGSDNSVIKGLNVRGFFNNIAIVRSNNNQI